MSATELGIPADSMSITLAETQHMSIYEKIYHNLCSNGRQRERLYKPKSGLHKHRINPGHQGGLYEENNITFLTVREHIIAHFLLWKLNKHPNDLRSMKMLGAKLTPRQRQITGEWCRDNKIGFHGASPEQRREWSMKGFESQKNSADSNSFYYWSTPEGRKKRASMGGKASMKSPNSEFAYWASSEGRTKRAKMGAAASGKKPATNGIITKKFKTDTERQEFLCENPEWRAGHHWSKSKKR